MYNHKSLVIDDDNDDDVQFRCSEFKLFFFDLRSTFISICLKCHSLALAICAINLFFVFLMTFCWVISIFLFPWPLQVNSSDQKVHFLVYFENGTPFHCSFSIDGWCLPTLTGRYEITVSSTQYTGNSYSLFRQWIGCQIRRSIRTQSHISVAAMTKQMTLSLDNNMLWIFFPKIKN